MSKKTESKVTRQGSTKNLLIGVRFSSQEELEQVEAQAEESGFSTTKQKGTSSYLKSLAREHQPKSVYDHGVMAEVSDLNARLGHVGGLFKIALREGWASEIKDHLSELNRIQRAARRFVEKHHPD